MDGGGVLPPVGIFVCKNALTFKLHVRRRKTCCASYSVQKGISESPSHRHFSMKREWKKGFVAMEDVNAHLIFQNKDKDEYLFE